MQARTLDAASGHWPEILQVIGGVSPEQLTNTHQPCPSCGGTDRFRWDNDEGPGGWYCSQCGGKNHQGGAGSGLDLLMRVKGWDLKQALRQVDQHLGNPTAPHLTVVPGPAPSKKPRKPYRSPAVPPAGAPPPALGRATAQWCYRDSTGQQLFWIQRLDKGEGSKGFVHRVWLDGGWHFPSSHDDFTCQWPSPRPLYRLPQLQARPADPVLVAEGEKAADAAAALLPSHVAVSWSGGCTRHHETDWGPLAGRTVVLWPDHDAAGRKAMADLGTRLLQLGCSVTVVHLPDDFPDGWDGWDLADADFGPERAAELLTLHSKSVEVPPPQAPPAAAPLPEAPYRVLGWSTKLDSIWVQTGQAGIVGSVPLSKAGLQRIAPIGYWEALFPGRTGPGLGCAISNVRDAAEALGPFTPDRIRGRGVWLDRDRVIWHLGNRIEVDGHQLPLTELRDSAYTYASLPALDINPEVPQLTDAEGTAILELFTKRLKWGNDGDGLLVAGHTVLGNVGGALETRPGLQVTGGTQEGKSTLVNRIIKPLQADLGLWTSASTAAGIVQEMKGDTLPVVIDESEQENAKQREGHLHLLRLSFDGQRQLKGTPGGQSNSYTMRSMITLIGINASVPNAADRNRLVVIRPRKLTDPAAWAQLQLDRDKLITIEAGRRLIRRTVSNLTALLANIKTFTAVMSSQSGSDRTHQVLGSLLAGAHHLTSTAVLDADAALAWLDAVGWSGLDEDALEATSADAEAKACLDHLLAYTVHWKHSDTGSITVLELLTIAKANPGATEAISALGRLGIKWDRERGLVVANSCKVFTGSKWANGNHRDHLLSLDKAQAVPSAVWFPGMGSKKGVSLPLPT
jgi:putative DNA primase/helicase